MAITPTSARTYTFLKNLSTVVRTISNPGSGDVSTYRASKGNYFIEFTQAEFADFFDACTDAKNYIEP